MLTLALSKGRIFEETAPVLAKAGIRPLEDPEQSLKKKCDFIISAFGSTLASEEIKVA